MSATPGALRNATGDNTWNGDITLAGDTTFASDSGRLTVGSALTLTHEGARADLTVTGAGNMTLNGRITGLGRLIKQGAGTLVVNNSSSANPNDYRGGTDIEAGELELQGGYASPDSGLAGRGVTLRNVRGAKLTVTNSEKIGSLSGGGSAGGNVEIANRQTLTVNNADDNPTTYAGVISGTDANLIKEGEGIFTLGSATGGQSDYTGNTEVKGGTLALGRDNAISGSGTLRVDNGSTFDLRTFTNTFREGVQLVHGVIDATGANAARDSDEGKLVLNRGSFQLLRGTVNAKLSGAIGLNKSSADEVTLNGLNSYEGATLVSGGTLTLGKDDVLPRYHPGGCRLRRCYPRRACPRGNAGAGRHQQHRGECGAQKRRHYPRLRRGGRPGRAYGCRWRPL